MKRFSITISSLFMACTVLLLSSCEAPKKKNKVVFDDMYNRTLCDFKSRAEFDDFVTGLLNRGSSYSTEYVSNLPCEEDAETGKVVDKK